jgi:hypothetical protein
MESELRYHHSARALHLALIEARYNDLLAHNSSIKYGDPSDPIEPGKRIPVLSFLGLKFEWKPEHIRIAANCETTADGDKVQYPGEWAAITAEGNGFVRVPPKRWLEFLADYMEEVAIEELMREESRASGAVDNNTNPNHTLDDLDNAVELVPGDGQELGPMGGVHVKLVMAHFAVSHGFIVTHLVKLRKANDSRWKVVGGVWRYGAR